MQAFRRLLLNKAAKAESTKCGVDCACATLGGPAYAQWLRCLESRLANVPAEWKVFCARTKRLDWTMGEIGRFFYSGAGLYMAFAFLVGHFVAKGADPSNIARPQAAEQFLHEFKAAHGFDDKKKGAH